MRFKSIILVVASALLVGALIVSCSEDGISGNDYMKLSAENKDYTFRLNDSIYQRCELHVGSVEKFTFSFDETFKSNDPEFYSSTIEIFGSSDHCPTTSISNSYHVRLSLTKQNDDKKFIDYSSPPDFNLTWLQKYEGGKIKVTGTFNGWLYQYYSTRPNGTIREPALLDSIYIDKGEFQVSVNY